MYIVCDMGFFYVEAISRSTLCLQAGTHMNSVIVIYIYSHRLYRDLPYISAVELDRWPLELVWLWDIIKVFQRFGGGVGRTAWHSARACSRVHVCARASGASARAILFRIF